MADHFVQTVKGPGRTEAAVRVYQDYVEHYEINVATDLASGVYRIPVEAGDTVLEVRARVKTAFDAGTFKIGDAADDDGYLETDDVTATGAGNMKRSLHAGDEDGVSGITVLNGYAQGKYYSAAGFVLITVATAVSGVLVVEVVKAGYPSNIPNYLVSNR